MNLFIDPKTQAHQLKKYLKEKSIDISLGNAYEAVSRIHGYPNWDTYSAIFKAHENKKTPATAHQQVQTATEQPEIKHPEQIRAEAAMEAEMAKALGYPMKHHEQVRAEVEMEAEMMNSIGYPANAKMARASQRAIVTKVYQYRSFNEARAFVHTLRLKNVLDWKGYSKLKPSDIPSAPDRIYKSNGWISWQDWLGTEPTPTVRLFKSFKEARTFIHALNLKDQTDWVAYCRSGQQPTDIPSNPNIVYKDSGWTSMDDWLGTDKST